MASNSYSNDCTILTATVPDDYIPQFLANKLVPLMPYSLPLYRRCQFHLRETSKARHRESHDLQPQDNNAEIWIALARPRKHESVITSDRWCTSWICDGLGSSVDGIPINDLEVDEHWLAAYINLTNPGETQVWAFGSWEAGFRPVQSDATEHNLAKSLVHKSLFQTLFAHLRSQHIPYIPHEPPMRWQNLLASGKLISLPYDRSKVLFGCTSEALWPYFHDDVVYEHRTSVVKSGPGTNGKETGSTCIARVDRPYLKYLVPLPIKQAMSTTTTSGFHFAPLSRTQLQLMLDRSDIPRTIELLESLVSVGLFLDQYTNNEKRNVNPIAWGILSKDASISSLHTEPDYRGRGLAECVVKQLITMTDDTFHSGYLSNEQGINHTPDDNLHLMHTDVSVSNIASQRVFEKMGGTVAWKVGWIEIIVGEV